MTTIASKVRRVPQIKEIIKAGQRWHVASSVNNEAGELANLSFMKAKMEFREQKSGKLLVELTHKEGIKLLDDTGEHNYEIDLISKQSMRLNNTDTVLADLWIFNGDEAYPIFNLTLSIERTHTQW